MMTASGRGNKTATARRAQPSGGLAVQAARPHPPTCPRARVALADVLARPHSIEFGRYLIASVIALALDYTLLAVLVHVTTWPQALSAAVSYVTGAIVHYATCRRFVFARGWLHARQHAEFAVFLASGGVGFALTVAIIVLGGQIGFDVMASKTAAVGASFCANYLARRLFVFRRGPAER